MGSHYLEEVLTSEESHLPNISSKISELISHANILKSDVNSIVEHSSVQFTSLLKENEALKRKSKNLLKEMTTVQEQIDGEIKNELSGCAEELESLSSSLKEVKLFLEILEKLLEISRLVRKAKEKLEEKEFFECANSVTAVKALVKNNSEQLKPVKVFKVLSQEVILVYEHLMYQISEVWSQCVNISIKDDSKKDTAEINLVILTEFSSDVSQILKASSLLKSNLIDKKFSQLLLNEILKKIIFKKCKIVSNIDNSKAVLLIELINNNNNKPNYLEVFESIEEVMKFLKSHLDIEIQDGVNFLSKIGNLIADEFADCLIKNCLSETIPISLDDLDKYKVVVENTQVFEKTLQESGFLPGSSSYLLDYARNINVLFANKFCQSYLHKARLIMKKDLYNVTESEDVVSNISVFPLAHRNTLKEKFNIKDDVFKFSKCQISKQADEVMVLIRSMLKEIEKSLDLCAIRLFCTVRNIFEMYTTIVPLHHKKFLQTLPHQVALFHNNCIYFSHYLIYLATETIKHNKIPIILKDQYTILLEEAVVLRSLGAETLEVTVTNQKKHFIYILRDSGFARLNENPKLDLNSEKSIRQCIRQMQILQNVWGEVLPSNVYSRAIGFLVDSVNDELINLIVSVEDISAQTASDLVSSFSVILNKAPSLLHDPREIYRYSRTWHKFQEFVLVLKGSLRDIDDHWADGTGPLAVEFTPEQIKHLIRALFQNSDRRAALLAKIR